MLFVVDVHREGIAIAEANRLSVRVIGMTDTNSDPDPIDIVIPSNDDAIRAIGLMASLIADAALEGRQAREAAAVVDEEPAEGQEPVEYDEDEEPLEPVFVHDDDDDDDGGDDF